MHSFSIISLLGAAATVLAAPSTPSSVAVPESIANATALGIDIYGPIPSDAVKQADGHWTADEGTKAWAWIRAQIDIDWSGVPAEKRNPEGKRAYANIGIGMFAQDLCNGQAGWFDDVQYDVQNYVTVNMYSVGISYRGLRNNEQLDFSKLSGSDWCGDYCYSAGQNTPVGCFNSQEINCFRLWLP